MSTPRCSPAVFLDRDGVIVADEPRDRTTPLRPLPGVADALRSLREAGFLSVLVTNQPDIARGRTTEASVSEQHRALAGLLTAEGAQLDGFYLCPHHPAAAVDAYRIVCTCRKPLPGLLLRAAGDLGIDVSRSAMVGDRMTDIEAGKRAGCGLTILVESGAHLEPRIVTSAPTLDIEPHARVANLGEAAEAILRTHASIAP